MTVSNSRSTFTINMGARARAATNTHYCDCVMVVVVKSRAAYSSRRVVMPNPFVKDIVLMTDCRRVHKTTDRVHQVTTKNRGLNTLVGRYIHVRKNNLMLYRQRTVSTPIVALSPAVLYCVQNSRSSNSKLTSRLGRICANLPVYTEATTFGQFSM